jgi:predicted kinase
VTLSLYALCGLPFAGKSTLAAALGARTGWPIVRLDAINGERGVGLDGAPISPEQWQVTYAEAYRRLAAILAAHQSVIFDHGTFSRAERDQIRAIGAGAGARVRFIYVPVTPEEARRRWLDNRRTRVRYDVRDDDFAQALRAFEPPDGEPDVLSPAALEEALTRAD